MSHENDRSNPGKEERQVVDRLAAIDADLLVDGLVDGLVARARALDRSAEVAARREAAQEALTAAMSDVETGVDELCRLTDEATRWARLDGIMQVPEVPADVVALAAQTASMAVLPGSALNLERPMYVAERAAFDSLPSVWVAQNLLRPPAVTAAELAAIDGYEAAVTAVAAWQRDMSGLRDLLARPGVDIVAMLGSASAYRAMRGDLADLVAKTNACTEAADAERLELGLTWRAPAR